MSQTSHVIAVPMRAARWSAHHPLRAIAAWLSFVLLAVGLAMTVPTVETENADYRVGESGRAEQRVADAGLDRPDTEVVLITAGTAGVLDRRGAQATADRIAAEMRALDGVAAVAPPLWSADEASLMVAVDLARGDVDLDPLREVTVQAQADRPDLSIRQSGDRTLDEAIDERVGEDLRAAEGISVPITLILMLLAFGALIAAGIPVLLAVTSVAATIGLLAPISHLIPAEGTVTSMVVLIGMAVGVDYSLFYLKREREERAAGRTTLEAVEIAAQTSGHAILVSGGAVIASMTGLFVMGGATFNSLAAGSIVVVAVAVLGSITVLPALLVAFGRRVDRPRVPLLWRLNARIGRGGLSRRILAPVLRHPRTALALSAVIVLGLAAPALGLRIHSANLDTLPASIPEVQTMRSLTSAFPSEGAAASVVVAGDPSSQDDVRVALEKLEEDAVATGHYAPAATGPETSADGSTTVLRLGMFYEESDERVDTALRELRDTVVPAAFEGTDREVWVGGGAAENLDFADRQGDRLPWVIAAVLVLTFLMMLVTFRSVVIAGVSTLLNLASVGVSFGLLVLVFQDGWGSDLLGFTSPGFVIDWLPLFVLVVLVGLSMDYHVFVVSRIREYVRAGVPTHEAVRLGIADTAGVVTSAAAVMVSVFAIFATLSMLEMKMMGVGLAAAILLDATLVRLVILPAVLVLLGERAWWPSRPSGDTSSPPTPEPSRPALEAARAG